MHIYPKSGSARKHSQPLEPHGLTTGGRLIWRLTGRPVATCNALADLAGFGGRTA